MATKTDIKTLEGAGLTESEAIVYIALLSRGASTAGPIMQKTGLQNSVLHRSLNSLINKGLIGFIMSGKNRVYQPEPPRHLLALLQEKEKDLMEIIPSLEKRLRSESASYAAELFLGKRAVFSALRGLITDARQHEEYLSISMVEPHEDEEVHLFYEKFIRLRREKRLLAKILANKKARPIWDRQYTPEQLRFTHTRYADFEFPQGVAIFRDTVLLVQWGEQPSDSLKVLDKFFMEFNKKRESKGIYMKALYNHDCRKFGEKRKRFALTKVKYMRQELETPAWMVIANDCIGIAHIKGAPSVFLIKDHITAETYHKHFEILWKQASDN